MLRSQVTSILFNSLGAQQLYDGNKVYTVVPENEEVTIEDKSDDENAITPSKMLTFYRARTQLRLGYTTEHTREKNTVCETYTNRYQF